MTPPEDEDQGITAKVSPAPPAVSVCVANRLTTPALTTPAQTTPTLTTPALTTLRKRPDFLRAASARRQGTGGFLLQARARDDGDAGMRVGYTASKKIGNAVARNRAKRRLRAVARAVLTTGGHPGWDYVLVAKPGATIIRDYAALLADLRSALLAVHKPR